MSDHMMRPGGMEIARRAALQGDLKEGDRLLDIGCGRGDTAAFLSGTFGLEVTGIDIDRENIKQAKRRFPDVTFSVGDAVMLDFASKTFNSVLLECSLSLISHTTEALHEAWCVLKYGGRLIISDLYWKKPTAAQLDEIAKNKAANRKPRAREDCETHEPLSECVACGAFVMDELFYILEEMGMKICLFEDRANDLSSYAAEILLSYGSFEEYAKSNPVAVCSGSACLAALQDKDARGNLGYFLLIAEKKEV